MVWWLILPMVVLGMLGLYMEAVAEEWRKLLQQRPELARQLPHLMATSSTVFYPYKYFSLWWALCRHPQWPQQYDLPADEFQHGLVVGGFYYALTTAACALMLWWWLLHA